jgi:uncharacterized phage-associated protein
MEINMDYKPYDALTVAKYFLSIPDGDAGDLVSNLKLQKLLYYAQGYYVGLHGHKYPLFSNPVYAWKHGPVVQDVYFYYSDFNKDALPRERRPQSISDDNLKFLEEIYRTFGRFSAWALREMTHREAPWLKNYKPGVKNIEIPLSDMEHYFKGKIGVVK